MRHVILIKKWLLLFVFIAACQFTYSQSFTFNNWYAFAGATVTEADECGTIFRVTASMNGWSPAQFQILKDGVPMGQSDLVSNDANIYYEGNGAEPAWRVKMDNSGESWSYSFYINTRVTPNRIERSLPTTPYDGVKATTSKAILTAPTQEFKLSGFGCSSVDTAQFSSYQWVVSEDAENWEEIKGATSETLTLSGLKMGDKVYETLYYALKANIVYTDVDKELISSPVKMSYAKPSMGGFVVNNANGKTFNVKEYEISSFSNIASIEILDEALVGFEGDVEYCLSLKSLEKVDAEWEEFKCGKAKEWKKIKPQGSALYRVIAKGKSQYSGLPVSAVSPDSVVIRVVHRADSAYTEENLWLDDFGMFASETSYWAKDSTGAVKQHTGTINGKSGVEYTIENFWAPDPFNYVKEHSYGLTDPNVINPSRDWCGKYRLDDGYYIITSNSYLGDGPNHGGGQDYWKGEDHTAGDENGGMLFVNCAPGKVNTLIYERDIYLKGTCQNVELLFSCFICNAVFKEGSNVPVNLRLDMLDENGDLVHSVSTGDIQRREQNWSTLPASEWANLTFKFPITGSKYTMQLYNNAAGGNENGGNDILIDDISISLCYPNIELEAGIWDAKGDSVISSSTDVQACLGETFQLHAFNELGITQFISNPLYLYQYKNASTEGQWKNYGKITSKEKILIETKKEDNTFRDKTTFRVIVAASESAIKEILEHGSIDLSCQNMYAINEALTIVANDPVVELEPDNSLYCLHSDKDTPVDLKLKIVSGTPKNILWNAFASARDTAGFDWKTAEVIECTEKDSVGAVVTIEVSAIKAGELYVARLEDKKCGISAPSSLSLSTADQVVLDIEISDTKVSFGESVKLTVESSNSAIDSFLWYGNGEKIKETEGVYELEYKATKNGNIDFFADVNIADKRCASPSDTVSLEVSLKVPNIITPYNDASDLERNNSFMKGYQVEIYNRYQQMIFEGTDGWDATYRGEIAEPGTYYYRLFLPDGTIQKGTLEVAKF
ncbi:MAG: gliding motility-associated C-terminal domain-containing protein [Paludibacteraceae bacterium]|nr:gliding motility-associated C-terminal domain-containing protein [Paludibacteraceae bacterium]